MSSLTPRIPISIPLRYNLEPSALFFRAGCSHFNSTKVQFGVTSAGLNPHAFYISIPLRYNLETVLILPELLYVCISIPLRYNLEAPPNQKMRNKLTLISIPLRYNLELVDFLLQLDCVLYFNSTKVQFGDWAATIFSRPKVYFNSTKVQFGAHCG